MLPASRYTQTAPCHFSVQVGLFEMLFRVLCARCFAQVVVEAQSLHLCSTPVCTSICASALRVLLCASRPARMQIMRTAKEPWQLPCASSQSTCAAQVTCAMALRKLLCADGSAKVALCKLARRNWRWTSCSASDTVCKFALCG